jgi:hypothetical protein
MLDFAEAAGLSELERMGRATMAKNIHTIAGRVGAQVVAEVPEAGGGAFGAARLAHIIGQLRARLVPGQGVRAGRPTDARWVRHPKVPMSAATERRLIRLAEEASTAERKISPMQLAAQILEDTLAGMPDERHR